MSRRTAYVGSITPGSIHKRETKMPKLKTHKGAKKRFKLTSKGKVKRQQALKNHILTKKTTKRKRKLRGSTLVKGKFADNIRQMIGG